MCKKLTLGFLVFSFVVVLDSPVSNHAYADAAFKSAYDRYYKKNEAPQTSAQKALHGKKTSCFTCHEKGRKGKDAKTYRNSYGKEVAKLLHKGEKEGAKFDRKSFAKLLKAEFRKNKNPNKPGEAEKRLQRAFVALEKVKAPNGKTYGENFARGIPPDELTVTK
jgi:cytochrome c553